MVSGLSTVILSLLAAASWGGSDFLGGLSGKRSSIYLVTIGSEFFGLLPIVVAAFFLKEPAMAWPETAWAAVAGIAGAGSLYFLYTALSTEKMGVIAPVSGVVGAIVSVIAGIGMEGLPGGIQIAGFVLALAGIWLLSRPNVGGVKLKAFILPLISGICAGIFFVSIHQASRTSVLAPVFIERFVALVLILVIVGISRPPLDFKSTNWPLLFGCGVLDASGSLLFTQAVRSGRLDVATVLASLFPGGTVLLAWILLKEKINRFQWLGIAVILAAIAMIVV